MNVDLAARASAALVGAFLTPDDGPGMRAHLADSFTTSELATLGIVFSDLAQQCGKVAKDRKRLQSQGLAPREPGIVA